MKKITLLSLILVMVFSFSVYAESISETTYFSFDGGSLLDFSLTGDLGNNLVVKGTYSIFDTTFFDASKFDIQGGYKYVSNSANMAGTYLFLVGFRKSEFDTGLLLSADFRANINEKAFTHDILEYISWSDSDTNALTSKFLIGYKLSEKIAVKGGITWVQSGGNSSIGPTFGFESSF